jgi:hypothetical protein
MSPSGDTPAVETKHAFNNIPDPTRHMQSPNSPAIIAVGMRVFEESGLKGSFKLRNGTAQPNGPRRAVRRTTAKSTFLESLFDACDILRGCPIVPRQRLTFHCSRRWTRQFRQLSFPPDLYDHVQLHPGI